MQYGIAFTPLVPSLVFWLALAAITVIAALLLLGRARGAAVRVTALALILLALANPSFTREDREPLSSVAAVVIDKSPSQNFGERTRETREAQEALVDSLKKIKGLEVRIVEAGQADGETDGTRLFGALSSAEWRRHSELFDENVQTALIPEASVGARKTPQSTSPAAVDAALSEVFAWLGGIC